MDTEEITYAPLTLRFGAYCLDALFSGFLVIPMQIGMRATGAISDDGIDPAGFLLWGVPAVAAVLFLIAYLDGEKGGTPGKWLLRIQVTDANSNELIGWRRGLVRRLMFWPEAIPFYLGYLWPIWDSRNQAWHDKVARSVVRPGRRWGVHG